MTKSFDPRLALGVSGAKISGKAIRFLGKGGGTAAPGLIAERIDSGLITKLGSQLTQGAVIVAGTNGKTTTSRMVADMATVNAWRVVHNRSGSNLLRGVATAFVDHASMFGQIHADVAVLESDEAAMPEIARRVNPRIILLNNLFRDQLDRYGELDAIAKSWRTVLEQLPATTTVVVNADDPRLAGVAEGITARCVYFGLDDQKQQLAGLSAAADAAVCSNCQHDLAYHALYVSHLGNWYCPNCGKERPRLDVSAGEIELHGVTDLATTMRDAGDEHRITVGIPGMYNAYNALAAATVAREMGIGWDVISTVLTNLKSAFGRIERFEHNGHTFTMVLAKNPTGFNEVIRMLTAVSGALPQSTLISINNKEADGQDVSWLWDVDFEMLAAGDAHVFTTGMRGDDMAVRLKYAGVPLERVHPLGDDPVAAFDVFAESIPAGEPAYIIPNYTAMLDLREALAKRNIVPPFWEH